jgi:peptidoglycan-associated lipoprotein
MAILRNGGLWLLLTALAFSGGCSLWKEKGPAPGSGVAAPATACSGNTAGSGSGRTSDMARVWQAGLGAGNNVIRFDADSDTLSGPGITLLERHAAFIKANPGLTIRLRGHADERGSLDYNLALGKRRAQAVSAFLQASGVDACQLRALSDGNLMPLAASDDETLKARNRRVDILYR